MRQSEIQLPDPGEESLDRLLRSAEWPEPTAESTGRLSGYWTRLTTSGMWSTWRTISAVAAVLVITLTGAWMFRRPARPKTPVVVARTTKVETIPVKAVEPGRPATSVELAMLRVVNRGKATRGAVVVAGTTNGVPLMPAVTGWSMTSATRPVVNPVVATNRALDAAALYRFGLCEKDGKKRDRDLDGLVAAGPRAAAGFVLRGLDDKDFAPLMINALSRNPDRWSDTLFKALDDSRCQVRSSASLALAEIDGPAITTRLIAMANADDHRREAVAALVRIHSKQAVAFVQTAKQKPELSGIVRSALAQI